MTKLRYPVALTIAGSDSGGGAGIQADLKTFAALGVFGISAITAITAQNTIGVRGIQPVDPPMVASQLDAVFEDFTIDAVKIGMLHNKEVVKVIVDTIDRYSPKHIILDPVMISTSGSKLMTDDTIEAIINHLFPRVTLITPNTDEGTFLSGIEIKDEKGMQEAGEKLLTKGCRAVLMKGGHLKTSEVTDILYSIDQEPMYLSAPTVHTDNTHGTGCTLSSAIAAYMALGYDLPAAVQSAKTYITSTLISGADIKTGHGYGPVNHFFLPLPLKKIPAHS